MQLKLKQEMGIFQASILEAFNKLSEQQKSFQQQINNNLSATIVELPSHSVEQIESDPKPSTSQVLISTLLSEVKVEVEFVGPPLPPNFQKRGKVSEASLGGVSDPDSDHNYHRKGTKPKKH